MQRGKNKEIFMESKRTFTLMEKYGVFFEHLFGIFFLIALIVLVCQSVNISCRCRKYSGVVNGILAEKYWFSGNGMTNEDKGYFLCTYNYEVDGIVYSCVCDRVAPAREILIRYNPINPAEYDVTSFTIPLVANIAVAVYFLLMIIVIKKKVSLK